MKITYLDSSSKRSSGAMGSAGLGDEFLVFVYPIRVPRVFHTFFCPALRVVGLREG